MSYNCILVPFDGSSHSLDALSAARDIAEHHDASLHVIEVLPISLFPEISTGDPTDTSITYISQKNYTELFDDQLSNAQEEMRADIGGSLDGFPQDKLVIDVIAQASTVDGIVSYAEDIGADLIVMGRRGLGALRGALGSVSYGVIRACDIPVLTVK